VKILQKREDEILEEQIAIEVALATEKDDSPRAEMEEVEVNLGEKNVTTETESSTDEEQVENTVAEAQPEVQVAKALPSIQQVKVITTKVKKKLEADYKREINELKLKLTEKDEEIARLKAQLEG